MKPLLIVPPAPSRWPALEALLRHKGEPWLNDLRRRFNDGVPGAHDAYAVIAAGPQLLANVCINKQGDVGVLGHCFTHPDHRGRGYARQLITTVLSWFDMTGGKWLYLGTTAELETGLYRKFGFEPLRRIRWTPHDRLMMVRRKPGVSDSPYVELDGSAAIEIRDVSRADWPNLVTMLQYQAGLDPRVGLDESAVTAELFTLDLIEHLERDAARLSGAFQGPRLVGLATLATPPDTKRTYAMLVPHTAAPAELRAHVLRLAHEGGYEQVEFPMETLGATASGIADAASEAPQPQAPPTAQALPGEPG